MAPQSTTSTPASLQRTGAVTASVPACSPGSCSERFFLPRASTPTVIPVAETTAAATSEAATAATSEAGTSGAATLVAGTSGAATLVAGTSGAATLVAGTSGAAGTFRSCRAAR